MQNEGTLILLQDSLKLERIHSGSHFPKVTLWLWRTHVPCLHVPILPHCPHYRINMIICSGGPGNWKTGTLVEYEGTRGGRAGRRTTCHGVGQLQVQSRHWSWKTDQNTWMDTAQTRAQPCLETMLRHRPEVTVSHPHHLTTCHHVHIRWESAGRGEAERFSVG